MCALFYNAAVLREPYSGVEVTVHQLACALAEYGSMPLTVCAPTGQRPIPPSPHTRLRTSRLASRSRLCRLLWEQTVLPVLLRRARAPLLHAPAYVAPLATPCPLVLTIHDLHIMTHPQFCRKSNRLNYSLLIPPSIRKASAIIAFSPHTQRVIHAYFPEAKNRTIVIPPGISPTFTTCTDFARLQAVRQRYKLPPSFLLFVGDLTLRKNVIGLISAFAIVQGERPDLHLVLAGAAPANTASALDAAIRTHGVGHRVTRTGYVAPDDLPVLYSLAQAFVFPSHDEGFGLPPIEAMACGCPVVCSGDAPIENCGAAAVACDPCDRASIASAVSLLLDHPDIRREKIEAGRKKAAEFNWRKAALATEAVYRAVLANPKKPDLQGIQP